MGINIRAEVSDYVSRVLGVVKEKYGLKDKSEAINRFVEMFGEEFVEQGMKDEALRELIKICDEHFRKHSTRKMSLKELDRLCGM